VCPTVFGPQDSYYEHSGQVYCHFHYSTRYAVKCTGCQTAILKQFVEINRYDNDEHWHPECYMINKFWNTKLATGTAKLPALNNSGDAELPSSEEPSGDSLATEIEQGPSTDLQVGYAEQESRETPSSLKEQQRQMEDKVYRIWTVLSTFEESSAACISEMLRFVSNSQLLEGVRMLERFILHVETLFAALDDLTAHFRMAKAKGAPSSLVAVELQCENRCTENSHVREARMLCKKTVNFFSLLSQTQDASRKTGISQELLSLVTGLAHYLKILIRIALTSSLKLEREFQNVVALKQFLNRLDRLARDSAAASQPDATDGPQPLQQKTYGYKSLTKVSSSIGHGESPSDQCESCRTTVEEECARIGHSRRWHLVCLRCHSCNRAAGREKDPTGQQPLIAAESPLPVKEFGLETTFAQGSKRRRIWCYACAKESGLDAPLETFDYCTRLEQYAFLLWVSLNKLFLLLKQKSGIGTQQGNLLSS
jgi:hypothetical protein